MIFHHLPVEEKVEEVEINSMKIGYDIDTLTIVDINELFKKAGIMFKRYDGVIFKIFRKVTI